MMFSCLHINSLWYVANSEDCAIYITGREAQGCGVSPLGVQAQKGRGSSRLCKEGSRIASVAQQACLE